MALTYGILDGEYSADQFSDIFVPMIDNVVANAGNKFALNLRSGLSVRISTGYAYVYGHWVSIDEPIVFDLDLSDPLRDRYDAIVVSVNPSERTAEVKVMADIDPEELTEEGNYICPLYVIKVLHGATTLYDENVTDKREIVTELSSISLDALDSYQCITSGIDDAVTDLVNTAEQSITAAEVAIGRINSALEEKKSLSIGSIVYATASPIAADKWLLCNGSPIPAGYTELIALIGNNTPIINFTDVRFHAYIYAGAPA